ncbi:MAG TPA: protein kinase, partial [bacterium]|nr:protein kinase [bacterium]
MLGKRINEIIIYEFIGHGGAGEVYKAKDEKTNNIYAVKIIKTKNKESEEEFLEETGILKKISHPDVVKIFDYGIFEDYAYIVMELIEYPTLEKYIKKNLSINEITKIILNIARTINYFHNYKPAIIHCDLKPSNIFVYNDFRIKISDFGSAYFIYNNQEFETIKTEIINIITTKEEDKTKISGTYFYTAPEIFLEKNFGFYNDIYSIGVILYQLLTGILPVGFIEMPSKFNPAYFVFDKIIIKSLHNDYKMRYQNLNEFIYDLEQLTKINESKEEYEKEQKKYITADYIPTRIILDLYDSMSIFSKPKEYLVFEEKKIFEDRTKSEKYFEEEKNYYIKEVEELLNKKNYELEKIVELIKKIFLIDENNLFAHTIIENLKREQHKNLYNVLKKIVKIKSNIEIIKRLTKEMEFISSGKTIIGYNYGKSRERPEHIVYVDAFYIDKYLTTIGEYREFKKNYKILKEYDNEKYPVINLNYYEVEEYAEYKNK